MEARRQIGIGAIMLMHDEITESIIGAAIEVHRHLGPGLLESAYEHCLCRELAKVGLDFERQVASPLSYKGELLECGFRVDVIVERKVLLELKSIEAIEPVHEAQLLTYLKLSGLRVGLLINSSTPLLKDGIVRRVL